MKGLSATRNTAQHHPLLRAWQKVTNHALSTLPSKAKQQWLRDISQLQRQTQQALNRQRHARNIKAHTELCNKLVPFLIRMQNLLKELSKDATLRAAEKKRLQLLERRIAKLSKKEKRKKDLERQLIFAQVYHETTAEEEHCDRYFPFAFYYFHSGEDGTYEKSPLYANMQLFYTQQLTIATQLANKGYSGLSQHFVGNAAKLLLFTAVIGAALLLGQPLVAQIAITEILQASVTIAATTRATYLGLQAKKDHGHLAKTPQHTLWAKPATTPVPVAHTHAVEEAPLPIAYAKPVTSTKTATVTAVAVAERVKEVPDFAHLFTPGVTPQLVR